MRFKHNKVIIIGICGGTCSGKSTVSKKLKEHYKELGVNKINTEGLSLEFSDVEGTNFVKNNITARIEAQVGLAIEQPLAVIYGDFTAA